MKKVSEDSMYYKDDELDIEKVKPEKTENMELPELTEEVEENEKVEKPKKIKKTKDNFATINENNKMPQNPPKRSLKTPQKDITSNFSKEKIPKLEKRRIAADKVRENSDNEKITSGIPNFDKLVEGGFEVNSTNLIVGGSGSGKSIFATQFLIEGMKRGEKTLYVTFEEKKKEFYKNMLRIGWDLADYEKKDLFMFLEYTPEKVKIMLEEGGGAIENTIVHHKVTRIVIDSITSFALLFDDELKKREAALTLFNMIAGWNCTALLTYEGDPIRDEGIDHKALEFEADSVILIYQIRDKGKRDNYLEILKMRGTKHATEVYKFKIDKEGIILDENPYAGDISR